MSDQSLEEKEFAHKKNNFASGISNAFDTGIAINFGIEAALIYQHIVHWIQQNIIHEKNQFENRTWTYMTYEQMNRVFPYLSIKQIRLGVSRLLEGGLILKGDFSPDRFIKPTYYAVPDESALVDSKKFYESAKRADRSAHMEPSMCPKGQLENAKRAALLIGTNIISTDIEEEYTSLKVSPMMAAEAVASMPTKVGEKRKVFSQEVEEIGQELIEIVKEAKADYKPPTSMAKVYQSVDLMLRVDKREAAKIIRVFRWALADSFWADKFFKPDPAKYLREKFDQLDAKMNAKAPENPHKVDRRLRDKDGNVTTDKFKYDLF